MTLMVNSGHFEKWPPNLLRGESGMPPYPKMFRIYYCTCVPILVLLEQFEQLVCYAAGLLIM